MNWRQDYATYAVDHVTFGLRFVVRRQEVEQRRAIARTDGARRLLRNLLRTDEINLIVVVWLLVDVENVVRVVGAEAARLCKLSSDGQFQLHRRRRRRARCIKSIPFH